jgi:hypothetical protein
MRGIHAAIVLVTAQTQVDVVLQALVVLHKLGLVLDDEIELERDEDGELVGDEVLAVVEAELVHDDVDQLVQVLLARVVELGRQDQTIARQVFPIRFVYQSLG